MNEYPGIMTVHYHHKPCLRTLLQGLVLLLGVTLMQPLPARDNLLRMAELKAEEVRKLRETGDIMPLETLLQDVGQNYPGRIIEIELDEEDDRYVYELEIVDDEGVVWELYFDAGTGELLERQLED